MKKKMLLSLSTMLFVGLMWYNLQQVQTEEDPGISNRSEILLAELDIMPVIAQAEGQWSCFQAGGICEVPSIQGCYWIFDCTPCEPIEVAWAVGPSTCNYGS
jgi:hypothetical protein